MLCFFNNLYKVKSEIVLHLGYYAKMLKNQMCQTGWARIWYNSIRPPKPGLLIGFSSCVTLCGIRAFISMKSLEVQAEGAGIISNVPHHHARRKGECGKLHMGCESYYLEVSCVHLNFTGQSKTYGHERG